MTRKFIAFFHFKKDSYENLQYAVIWTTPELEECGHTSGYERSPFRELYEMFHERTWIGVDILNNDIPMLEKACAKIKKPPPIPKSVIDMRPFSSSGSKLAKVASKFGLGNQAHGSHEDCHLNFRAIKHCGNVMSLFEEQERRRAMKTRNGWVNFIPCFLISWIILILLPVSVR